MELFRVVASFTITFVNAADFESPAEREEREAVQAGAEPFYDDAVSAWAEQEAYDEWLDDEWERVMADQDYHEKEMGIF